MEKKSNLNILIGVFIAIVLLFHIGYFAYLFIRVEHDKLAHIGDSFGFINSLFSGLAFAILIGTIYLQKNELELQRQELSLTREELSLTREEHKRSSHAAELSAKYIQEQAEAMKLDNEIGLLGQLLSVYHEEEKRIEKSPDFNQEYVKRKANLLGEVFIKREKIQKLLEGHYQRIVK